MYNSAKIRRPFPERISIAFRNPIFWLVLTGCLPFIAFAISTLATGSDGGIWYIIFAFMMFWPAAGCIFAIWLAFTIIPHILPWVVPKPRHMISDNEKSDRRSIAITWSVILAISTAVLTVAAFCFISIKAPHVPAILEGASAGGRNGPSEICDIDRDRSQNNNGPSNVAARFQTRFPKGSPVLHLRTFLDSEGFQRLSPCDDTSIESAQFDTHHALGGSTSVISWKSDKNGNIEWLTAYVSHESL